MGLYFSYSLPFELDAAPGEIVGTYADVYKKAQQLHCPGL